MLREFDHSHLLHEVFTQSAPLIAEMSSYLRKSKLVYQTKNHSFERLAYMNEFPILKELYLKYNCIFATEADVERVFSYAGSFNYLLYCDCFVPFVFYSLFVFIG